MTPSAPRRARVRFGLRFALCGMLAAVAAVANVRGGLVAPPESASSTVGLGVGGASALMTVGLPAGTSVPNGSDGSVLAGLARRALLLSEVASTPPVLAEIAHAAGIDARRLTATVSYVAGQPEAMARPDFEVRASQLVTAAAPFHVDFEPDPIVPRVSLYTRAPTVTQANALANAVVPGLARYLASQAPAMGGSASEGLAITQLGPSHGAVLNGKAKYEVAGLTFMVVLVALLALFAVGRRAVAGWRADDPAPEPAADGAPRAPASQPAPAGPDQWATHPTDDWPRTGRALPWLVAAYLGMLWLLPFDAISIGGSTPIDLKLDRIVLPMLLLTWIVVRAVSGRTAPRRSLGAIGVAVLGFTLLTYLTAALEARALSHDLVVDLAVKRLSLLTSYVLFFFLVSTGIRHSEVPAFLKLMLRLSVLAAIGTIIEYRFHYNVFYDFAHKLLPGFQVGAANSSGVDDLGRRLVEGPADLPLEAVGMFTLALPIALVGLLRAGSWRSRILSGLGVALLLAAALSTERKSAMLGPVAVILTIAVFRRGQMLRLVPLAVVLLAVVKLAVPGAITGVSSQLAPNRLNVATVDERVVRYDAIRPDLWAHPVLGRGFGTYYPVRVLDNELLGRLVEGGLVGLLAYVGMLLCIATVGARLIHQSRRPESDIGLVAAAAAIGALVLSALYDFLGFAHGPYILLALTGLLVARLAPAAVTPSPVVRPSRGQSDVARRELHPGAAPREVEPATPGRDT